MREIKFKACDEYNKQWLNDEIFNIDFNGTIHRDLSAGTISGIILCQFTGLKDKNGKEIYEGNIVKSHTYDTPYEIIWSDLKSGWLCFSKTFIGFSLTKGNAENNIEVIGNIYENPELLD